ncbi:hypothetical protein LY90DRAFT_506993 [Neocallimastix californiae]|jgi:1,4-alpha-glucan branching enzyme|uniref:AMP-activated protein kinase glycogen-binding domain-containing protein n=1 Tax=Neocallimastix californiae TaxID=1754190 RepID=A0A1Y2D999_9FUNG|nr:hypothetical protein LY90DRAFT_506993 [Neocallimastix californiae]|eukprot:ORY55787.1 hypothetical protein LY90DRAFT_506993 [Neocallimastix californiae]
MPIIQYKITYPSRYASSVRLVGDFGTWSGWVDMKRDKQGYTSNLFVQEGTTIKYKFFVDGKHWGFDPTRNSTTDEEGHVCNVECVRNRPSDSEESSETESLNNYEKEEKVEVKVKKPRRKVYF